MTDQPTLHHIVHGGEKAVGTAEIGQHLDAEIAGQLQAPVVRAGRAGATGQAFGGIPGFQVLGVEMHGLARADDEHCPGVRRRKFMPPIVEWISTQTAGQQNGVQGRAREVSLFGAFRQKVGVPIR
ncbi:MAG: hypothetical protein OXQ29_04050 [Rhodospirillaceae bacterium]|nr:hypothetical protein [Rhodospirillaceae bacterium]